MKLIHSLRHPCAGGDPGFTPTIQAWLGQRGRNQWVFAFKVSSLHKPCLDSRLRGNDNKGRSNL